MSISPENNAGMSASFVPSTTLMATLGRSVSTVSMAIGNRLGDAARRVPITTRPLLPSVKSSSSCAAFDTCASISLPWRINASPYAVGITPRLVRRNSFTSKSSSRSWISFEAAGCEICNLRAAFWILPYRPAVTSNRSCRSLRRVIARSTIRV